MTIAITKGELLQLRDLVQGYCGIRLEEQKLEFLKDRLAPIIVEMGQTSLGGLCQLLLREMAFGSPKAWNLVLPLVTINETYFFREIGQLELFRDRLLPELVAKKTQRKLRLLSAPCSTGEEPLSLAMMLDESPVNLTGWQIEIIGVDIDPQVIDRATQGLYNRTSFRATDPRYISTYFQAEGVQFKTLPKLRNRVTFRQGNLLDMGKWANFQQFDAIFCRNMLIYFDKPTQKKLIQEFHRALNPGGLLLLGHSESLLSLEVPFKAHTARQAIYYQKEEAREAGARGLAYG